MQSSIQPSEPNRFQVTDRDILAELLADKRSPNTRRAYARDLKDFFQAIAQSDPSADLVSDFLKLERFTAIALVLQYKAGLINRGLAEATVNRRLAAIKSLVRYAQKVGRCQWSLEEVEGERVQAYRDTSGVDVETYRKILELLDRSTLAGKRNAAILLLLWSNVLRRDEVVKLNVGDFSPDFRTLRILGKGKGTQAETVSLSVVTTEAIAVWLAARGAIKPSDPLFISLSRNSPGHRLTGNSIYNLVSELAVKAGISKKLSPHRVRHSGITAVLDATGGDVRRVQKLSRHKKIETVMVYDDNRINHQADLTDLLGDMLG